MTALRAPLNVLLTASWAASSANPAAISAAMRIGWRTVIQTRGCARSIPGNSGDQSVRGRVKVPFIDPVRAGGSPLQRADLPVRPCWVIANG